MSVPVCAAQYRVTRSTVPTRQYQYGHHGTSFASCVALYSSSRSGRQKRRKNVQADRPSGRCRFHALLGVSGAWHQSLWRAIRRCSGPRIQSQFKTLLSAYCRQGLKERAWNPTHGCAFLKHCAGLRLLAVDQSGSRVPSTSAPRRNQRRSAAMSVQFVPGARLMAFDFAAEEGVFIPRQEPQAVDPNVLPWLCLAEKSTVKKNEKKNWRLDQGRCDQLETCHTMDDPHDMRDWLSVPCGSNQATHGKKEKKRKALTNCAGH
eukprot:527484-Rhodomonas_salina.4